MNDNRLIQNIGPYRSARNLLLPVLLMLLTLLVYRQVKDFEFLNFDDPTFTTANYTVQKGITIQGLREILTNPDYFCMQLAFISHMLDCHLFGLDAGWHHITNLILHLFNTLILFYTINRMSGAFWRSAVVAALFALHPLNVESVAWIAERRNVLSTFFWFSSLLAYWHYTQRRSLPRYTAVLVLFIFGLTSKAMLVTLPFLLLLLDFWPLRRIVLSVPGSMFKVQGLQPKDRISDSNGESEQAGQGAIPVSIRSVIIEKLPLIAISAAASYLTMISAHNQGGVKGIGGLVTLESIPIGFRIANALVSYLQYIKLLFWPLNLSVYYPYPESLPHWQVGVSAVVIFTLSWLAFQRKEQTPWFFVGWFWYLGTLVPVIGIVQLGGQALADRYIYVPAVGIFIVLVWGITALGSRERSSATLLILLTVVGIIVMAFNTWMQVQHWRNSLQLFTYTTRMTPDYAVAQNNLGMALAQNGKPEQAIPHIQKAIALHPEFAEAYNNLGNVLSMEGKNDAAIECYLHALRISPEYAEAHNNLGIVLFTQDKKAEAVRHFRQALQIDPDYPDARHNLAIATGDTKQQHAD